MKTDYDKIIEERAQRVFNVMSPRTADADMERLKDAFELAREAHSPQVRKTGEPYILHPVAVATIAAEELNLDVNSVIAAFLHDVVEDTPHPIEELRSRFGDDVAFLVNVLTKREKKSYDMSKQVDNFRQILESMQKDIRPIMIKLADRLHNMRTLSSMRSDKQMKIAGETDYFYAPLANRLGLYHVKTELENLSFRFRCPHDFEEISGLICL
ncbi:MAG: HD domain-containing protein [Muribaculaceae bacterium]|nr:HD domain-containing protein [Muribaculaceae bacterium]